MAVTVYRSTTGGAPSYTTGAGILLPVLDYALVTGQSWTKTSLGTNQASYTQPSGSNGFVLQVDDSNASNARLLAFETLSALNTGTNQTPSNAYMTSIGFTTNNGFYVNRASGTYTSSGAPWRLFTNGTIFYLFIQTSSTSLDVYSGAAFGDITSYKAGDAYNTIITGQAAASLNYKVFGAVYQNGLATVSGGSATLTGFLMRQVSQLGTGIQMAWVSDYVRANGSLTSGECSSSTCPFPSVVDGSLVLAPVWVAEPTPGGGLTSNGIRGLLPGIWFICHPSHPFPDGYQFTASSGNLAGRTFEAVGLQGTASGFGQVAVEISNTWGGF